MERNKTGKPFVFQSSGRWIGNDGNWSAFYVSVGTPPQIFHVLPSLYGQSIYVPISDDCERLNVSDCAYSRGAEWVSRTPYKGFQTNKSSSWKDMGLYEADIGTEYGISGIGKYGTDRIVLSQNETGEMPTVNEQSVLAYLIPEVWTGLLGLSPHPFNFSTGTLPSLMGRLKELNLIPSLSFAYQAGAYYRKIPGSLALGGYDRSLVSPDAISFPFVDDLYVGLQNITMSSSEGNVTLLSEGISLNLDTAIPDLWLPPAVCDSIASALGLTYLENAERYTMNPSTYAKLQTLSPTFSFTVGRYRWGGQNVVINIPYAAFNLQAGYPIFNTPIPYFPLRRGNESTYTLGRAFLQEVYLTVDWERSTMSIGQAVFQSPMPTPDIVLVESTRNNTSKAEKRVTPAGTIAGAVVGAGVLLIFLALLVWWLRRRRIRRKSEPTAVVQTGKNTVEGVADKEAAEGVVELADTRVQRELHNCHINELDAPHGQNELQNTHGASDLTSSQVYELPHSSQETPGEKG